MLRLQRSSTFFLGIAATALTMWATESEARASVCKVNDTRDNVSIPKTLRWCVDQVAQGHANAIELIGPGPYPLDTPLRFQADAIVYGGLETIVPSPIFVGDSLLEIGGSRKVGLIEVNLDAAGVFGPRALLVEAGSILNLRETYVINFMTAKDGAAARVEDASLMMRSSGMYNNVANLDGGAIAVDPASTNAVIELIDAEFRGNEGASGGAIHTGNATTFLSAEDSDLEHNIAASAGGALVGGGHFVRCLFQHNQAAGPGGAIYAFDDGVVLRQAFFNHNEADAGGAVALAGASDLEVRRSAFTENDAWGEQGGGAVHFAGSTATMINSTFAHNEAMGTSGAGSISVDSGQASLDYLTIAWASTGGGPAGLFVGGPATVTMRNTILGNSGPNCDVAGTLVASTSFANDTSCGTGTTVTGGPPVGGCGGADWEFHCIPAALHGMGSCAEPIDQLGMPRPTTACFPGAIEMP